MRDEERLCFPHPSSLIPHPSSLVPSMLPSFRLALLLALGSLFFFAAAYLPALSWGGLLFDGVVVALCGCDLLLLRAAERVSATRQVEETLSLGAPEPVRL